jgi:hypothetical protein
VADPQVYEHIFIIIIAELCDRHATALVNAVNIEALLQDYSFFCNKSVGQG